MRAWHCARMTCLRARWDSHIRKRMCAPGSFPLFASARAFAGAGVRNGLEGPGLLSLDGPGGPGGEAVCCPGGEKSALSYPSCSAVMRINRVE